MVELLITTSSSSPPVLLLLLIFLLFISLLLLQDQESWQRELEVLLTPGMRHENLLLLLGAERRGPLEEEQLWLITQFYERVSRGRGWPEREGSGRSHNGGSDWLRLPAGLPGRLPEGQHGELV